MDLGVESSPRKARKSMRSRVNTTATPNINQSLSDTTTLSVSTTVRKSARKSTGTRGPANTNRATQSGVVGTSISQGISQNTTIPISLPSSRDDNLSDSDVEPARTRNSFSNSLNSTAPISKPGCSRDPESSDYDTAKIPRPKVAASKTSKNAPIYESSSPPSTSEESDVEEMLKKKEAKLEKARLKAGKSSSKSAANNVGGKSLADPEKLVSQCVFYILVVNRRKKAIKKRDIVQHVFEGRNTQLFPEILKKAASVLQKTFGFELMELQNSKNEYLLVNSLCHQYGMQGFAEYSPMDHQINGLIFYILTLIYMNQNPLPEDELWKALDPLGIEIKSRKPHPVFGDVQKLITNTLVRQMYFTRRQTSKDPPQFELLWGERAHNEVLKEDLLDFVCKIMPDTKPEEWSSQYKDATGRAPEDNSEMEIE